MNLPAPSNRRPADLAPLSPGKRLWLLTILVVLPVFLVMLPAVVVTHFFGRRPTFESWRRPAPEPDVSQLRGLLERTAQAGLPAPTALTPEPLELTVPPARLAARAEKITRQAQELGGSATEGLPVEGEKHLFVELPAGRGEAFRQLVAGHGKAAATPLPSPANPATAAASAGGSKDRVEVIIRVEEE
jgi:hypothetical protein